MPSMSAMPICWDQATDPTERRLMVGGDIRAVVTRWSPRDRPDRTDWWAAEGLDGNCRVGLGLFDFPGQACRAAAVHAGVAIAAPDELIAEYGEPSEGAAVAQKAPIAQPPLADRLAALLAEKIGRASCRARVCHDV